MAKPLSQLQAEKYGKELEKIVSGLKKDIEKLLLKAGSMDKNIFNIQVADLGNVYNDVQELINNSGYFEATKNALDSNQDILTERLDSVSKQFKMYDFGGLPLEKLQAIVDLDLSTIGGQSELAFEHVRSLLQQNVINGVSFDTLVESLEKTLEKDLNHNAKTLLATAKRQFAQSVENDLADEIGFGEDDEDMWEYVGDPLVNNSHEECIWALSEREHPYFTNEQKQQFEAGIYPAHLSDRSAIRYNCHHNFWISNKKKSELEKEFGVVE